jgi:nitroreductase
MTDSLFFRRHSKRAYLDKAVPEESLERIFEIVRWSPSCSNNQPWRFVVVTDPDRKAMFMKGLARGNQWAAAAPVLIAVCGRPEDDYNREDNRVQYYQVGCGLAVMSLLLAAVDEGLMGHAMAGYSAPDVKAALDIPDDYDVITVVALGYEGSIDQLDDRTRAKDEAQRTRKPLSEIVARDTFEF